MERLYTKRALTIKAAYCFLLPLLQLFAAAQLDADDFLWLLVSSVVLGSLYTIPFWLSVYRLSRYGCKKLRGYIAKDALCCLAPAVLSALLYEIGVFIFVDASQLMGLYTVMLFVTCLLISGFFWILYPVAGKHNRP